MSNCVSFNHPVSHDRWAKKKFSETHFSVSVTRVQEKNFSGNRRSRPINGNFHRSDRWSADQKFVDKIWPFYQNFHRSKNLSTKSDWSQKLAQNFHWFEKFAQNVHQSEKFAENFHWSQKFAQKFHRFQSKFSLISIIFKTFIRQKLVDKIWPNSRFNRSPPWVNSDKIWHNATKRNIMWQNMTK